MRGKRVAGEREEIKLGGLLPLSFSLRSTILNTARREIRRRQRLPEVGNFSLSLPPLSNLLSLALTTLPTRL